MTAEDADTPELTALAESARRRQRRWLATILGGAAVTAVLAGFAISMVTHRHAARHHPHTAVAVLALTTAVLVLAAEVAIGLWLVKTGRDLFRAPLALGLPYRDRRVVMKAVRRGTPPPEPMLRTVGFRMAERIIRYRKQALALYTVIYLSQVVNALMPDRSGPLRGLSITTAVLLLGAMAYQRVVARGARRYLEQCRQPGPDA